MNYEDIGRIKKMKCLAFDEGLCLGHTTILVLDGEELESGGIIRETGLARILGWGGMDGEDCVEFEISDRCGRYTTTYAEWSRCVEIGDFAGLGHETWRLMRRNEYAEKAAR